MKKSLLVLTISIILLLTGCKNEKVDNNSYENTNTESNATNSSFEDKNNNFVEFKKGIRDYEKYIVLPYSEISTDKIENAVYIVGKDEKGIWKEIINENVNDIIGTYENKLYFTNDNGIYYIDLVQSPFIKTEWIKYREFDVYHEAMPEDGGSFFEKETEQISNPHIYGEDIYFNYSSYAGGTDTKDGIQKLNINSKSLNDAIQINPNVSLHDWTIDDNSNSLYYLKNGFGVGDTLCRYDLVNNVTEELFKNVEDFDIRDNKVLYYVWNNHVDSGDKYGHYDLYLYNLETKENTYITKTNAEDIHSGNLWSYAEYRNNSVYYKSGDSIVKYNDGNREVLYTYSQKDGGTEFYGFDLISDDLIRLVTQGKYLKNGIIYETIPNDILTDVIMNDGTTLRLVVLDKELSDTNTTGTSTIINNQQQEATMNDDVINYDTGKKFVYLINNEVFATRVGNNWYNREESVVTLKDLFDSEAFYPFEELSDTQQTKTSTNTIAINKFSNPNYDNKEWFNHVHSILGEENLVDVIETEVITLGDFPLAEQYIYKLPIYVTDSENIVNRLNVYSTNIEIFHTSDLFSNDGNLKIIEPTLGDKLSIKANEWLNTYLTDNNINILHELMAKSFKLNIDKDENIESVYLVYNEMTYPIVDEDKISMIIIEDDEKITGFELCKTTFRSQNDNEFRFSGYGGGWKEDISLRFADFDYDGIVEILIDSIWSDLESSDYHELYKISGDSLKLISAISGPNN